MTKIREMTPELKKKLEGLLPISKTKGIPFKPDIYKDDLKDFSPTIHLRGWTVDEQNAFVSGLKDAEESGSFNELMYKHSHVAILEIESLIDLATGDYIEVPMKNGKPSWEFYRELPLSLIMSIFKQVQRLSGITQEEAEGLG